MILTEQPRVMAIVPDESDTTLALGSLNALLALPSNDLSSNAKHGTVSGGVTLGQAYASLDGTDDKIDYGDLGNIVEVSMWVKPATTTEELVLVDTGNDIMISGGTVTYTGLTASATYVNGAAGTTVAAGEWSNIVCQFAQIDANNFELGTDGANFGQIEVRDLRAYTTARTAAQIAAAFGDGVTDSTLALSIGPDGKDYSRFDRTITRAGGIVVGDRMTLDGTDDKLDAGDVGNIVEVSGWIKPSTTTQELFLVNTGKDIMVNAGTVTYTGLTPSATYVDGAASTTMVAGKWQHLVCQFAQTDANNMELGNDGANYGAFDCGLWEARATARTAGAIAAVYGAEKDLAR